MNLNQEMLNKYATGNCSEAEKLLVEKWLENESWETIEEETNKVDDHIGRDIWNHVKPRRGSDERIIWRKIAVVASVLFALLIGFLSVKSRPIALDSYSFTNESADENKFFSKEFYDVELGGNTNASIDLINNRLVFSGDFIIEPKKDFELLDSEQNTLVFKAGRRYFVSDSPDFGKIVSFQKSDLELLPSLMQIRIRKQFQSI